MLTWPVQRRSWGTPQCSLKCLQRGVQALWSSYGIIRVLGRICLFLLLSDQTTWGWRGDEERIQCFQQTPGNISSGSPGGHWEFRHPSPVHPQEVLDEAKNWGCKNPNINCNKSLELKSRAQAAGLTEGQNGAREWRQCSRTRSGRRWRQPKRKDEKRRSLAGWRRRRRRRRKEGLLGALCLPAEQTLEWRLPQLQSSTSIVGGFKPG